MISKFGLLNKEEVEIIVEKRTLQLKENVEENIEETNSNNEKVSKYGSFGINPDKFEDTSEVSEDENQYDENNFEKNNEDSHNDI